MTMKGKEVIVVWRADRSVMTLIIITTIIQITSIRDSPGCQELSTDGVRATKEMTNIKTDIKVATGGDNVMKEVAVVHKKQQDNRTKQITRLLIANNLLQ